MKKFVFVLVFIIFVVIGVLLRLGLEKNAHTLSESGERVGGGLCIGGLNLQTALDVGEFQVSPPGPLLVVYKDQVEHLALYPIIDLKNATGFNLSEPAFEARNAQWKVYGPKDELSGATGYAVDGPMPFVIGTARLRNDEVRQDILQLLNTMTPGECSSPNPGEYDPSSAKQEASSWEEYRALYEESPVCKNTDIEIVSIDCAVDAKLSGRRGGTTYYEGGVTLKNVGKEPVTGVQVDFPQHYIEESLTQHGGLIFGLQLQPGESGYIDLSRAYPSKGPRGRLQEDLNRVNIYPYLFDAPSGELCLSKKIEREISCR